MVGFGPRGILRMAGPLLVIVLMAALAGCAAGPVSGNRGVGPATPSTTPSAGTATTGSSTPPTVHRIDPYSATGTLDVPVAAHRAGSCWTASIAVADPDAFRCLAGNTIEDPCFAPPAPARPSSVVCLPDPWSAGTVLSLTAALPTGSGRPRPSPTPWALELANGAHCVAVTGTVSTVAGVALNYHCGGDRSAGLIRTGSVANRAEYAATTAGRLTSVAVTAVWFG
jgi:hypothetical protein